MLDVQGKKGNSFMIKELEYMVVCNRFGDEYIYYYYRDSELEAHKHYKIAKGK